MQIFILRYKYSYLETNLHAWVQKIVKDPQNNIVPFWAYLFLWSGMPSPVLEDDHLVGGQRQVLRDAPTAVNHRPGVNVMNLHLRKKYFSLQIGEHMYWLIIK
jgi:hypothetical protein